MPTIPAAALSGISVTSIMKVMKTNMAESNA